MKQSKAKRVIRGYRIKAFPERAFNQAVTRVTHAATSADYRRYERAKAELQQMDLSSAEYERRIQQLAERYGI